MKLAAIFSDNMVLQRNTENYIFGTSDKDETITVEIDNIRIVERVSAGEWHFTIPAHPAGGPYDMTIICTSSYYVDAMDEIAGDKSASDKVAKGTNPDCYNSKYIIRNIVYGEVWLMNGQSNIEFELKDSEGGLEEINNSSHPEIRYYNVIRTPVIDDEIIRQEEDLSWKTCIDGDFGDVSAIGYYYALRLSRELRVPVGLIDCYQGGSSITCWLERSRMEKLPEASSYLEAIDEATSLSKEESDRRMAEYDMINEEYCARVEELLAKNPSMSQIELITKVGNGPWPPPLSTTSLFRPAGLVETMLKRIVPYTIKGVLFYQGEEDAYRNYEYLLKTGENRMYKALLNALIEEYRDFYKRPPVDHEISVSSGTSAGSENYETPVILVQLPMYGTTVDEDVRDWAYIREIQEAVAEENKNVYMTTILDAGEYCNIHPMDKKLPGERLAGTALEKLYDRSEDGGSDMLLKNITLEKQSEGENIVTNLILDFDNIYSGVELRKNALTDIREESEELIKAGVGNETGVDDIKAEKDDKNSLHKIFGFEISIDGIEWTVPASELQGNKILIKNIGDAAFIRYGFFNYGKVNVYNGRGYMLRPFSRGIR